MGLIALLFTAVRGAIKPILLAFKIYRYKNATNVEEKARAMLQIKRDARDLLLAGINLLSGGIFGGFEALGGMQSVFSGVFHGARHVGALAGDQANDFLSGLAETGTDAATFGTASTNIDMGTNAYTGAGEENLRTGRRVIQAKRDEHAAPSISAGRQDVIRRVPGGQPQVAEPIEEQTEEQDVRAQFIATTRSGMDAITAGDARLRTDEGESAQARQQIKSALQGGGGDKMDEIEAHSNSAQQNAATLDTAGLDKVKANSLSESELESTDKKLDQAEQQLGEKFEATPGEGQRSEPAEEQPKGNAFTRGLRKFGRWVKRGFGSLFSYVKQRAKRAMQKLQQKLFQVAKQLPGFSGLFKEMEAGIESDAALTNKTIKPTLAESETLSQQSEPLLEKLKAKGK
jgi:hypothetical protein